MRLCFNPRPPRRAGATSCWHRWFCDLGVSILARPEGRALPHSTHNPAFALKFQSSPAPKGGRYARRRPSRTGDRNVSILARPEGRALLAAEFSCNWSYNVSILARPEGRALPGAAVLRVVFIRFQSSPAPKGGRYPDLLVCRSRHRSFNPRPPRRAGATWACAAACDWSDVSILARPEGRALPAGEAA